jgi:hypothetical protein
MQISRLVCYVSGNSGFQVALGDQYRPNLVITTTCVARELPKSRSDWLAGYCHSTRYIHASTIGLMDGDDHRDSWLPTPKSTKPGSFYDAATTVDDLTLALTNYSRVPSPEPPPPLTCCCGSEDCKNTEGWLGFKSKLESRLILSAGERQRSAFGARLMVVV